MPAPISRRAAFVALVVITVGCAPSRPGVDAYTPSEPETTLSSVVVSVATSPALEAFGTALQAEMERAFSARNVEASIERVPWTPRSDSMQAPPAPSAGTLDRGRRTDATTLLVLREVKHGTRRDAHRAPGWGYADGDVRHVTVVDAHLVDVETEETRWRAQITTEMHPMSSDRARAQTLVRQLTVALVRDGWIAPLLATSTDD